MPADAPDPLDVPKPFHDRPTHGVTPRFVVGVCITAIGTLLLLENLHFPIVREVLRLWPVGLIALGLVIFSQALDIGGRVNGGAMVFFGSLLLLQKLDLLRVNFWDIFWPLALMFLGANLVRQNLRGRAPAMTEVRSNETVSLFAALGGTARKCNSPHFRGGDLTALMGGCQLDLRNAVIPPGESAVLDVFALMGGHEILVPTEWTVVTKVLPFMGGVEDKTGLQKGTGSATLVIRGFVMMGGVEIKH